MEQVAANPSEESVLFASPVVVKRSKMSYGKPGVLALTASRLLFLASEPAYAWDVQRSSIAKLKKPWYGMGSYVTFKVDGEYYALAFGQRGPNVSANVGNLAIRYGGTMGLAAGGLAEVAAAGQLIAAARIGGEWWRRLNA